MGSENRYSCRKPVSRWVVLSDGDGISVPIYDLGGHILTSDVFFIESSGAWRSCLRKIDLCVRSLSCVDGGASEAQPRKRFVAFGVRPLMPSKTDILTHSTAYTFTCRGIRLMVGVQPVIATAAIQRLRRVLCM